MPYVSDETVIIRVPTKHQQMLTEIRNSTRNVLSLDLRTHTLHPLPWYVLHLSPLTCRMTCIGHRWSDDASTLVNCAITVKHTSFWDRAVSVPSSCPRTKLFTPKLRYIYRRQDPGR